MDRTRIPKKGMSDSKHMLFFPQAQDLLSYFKFFLLLLLEDWPDSATRLSFPQS